MKKKENSGLDELTKGFGKVTLANVLLEVIFLILGLVIYFNARVTMDLAGTILGVYFLIFGIFAIGEFFIRKYDLFYPFHLVSGILSIILGIFVIANPFKIIKILTFTLGIYLIITSVVKIMEALKLHKYGYEGWLVMLVTALILLVFGIFVTINPMASLALTKATGIFIILASILEICNLIMMYTNAKDIVKFIKGE